MNLSHIHVEYPFTYGLIALITLVYFGTMGNPQISENLLFSSFQIRKNKQYYRILSPALIHGGIVHLIMNGIGIYYFGPVIEQFFGAFLSWIIFILSVAGGSLLPLWVRREELNYQAVGASGGVSGLIMVGMFLYPDKLCKLLVFLKLGMRIPMLYQKNTIEHLLNVEGEKSYGEEIGRIVTWVCINI